MRTYRVLYFGTGNLGTNHEFVVIAVLELHRCAVFRSIKILRLHVLAFLFLFMHQNWSAMERIMDDFSAGI